MSPGSSSSVLRQALLVVSVLDDLDVIPDDAGARLGATVVTWAELAAACAGVDPLGAGGRRRITALLTQRRDLALLGPDAEAALRDVVRPLALPAGHVDHAGPGWAVAPVPGGVLWLGLGVDAERLTDHARRAVGAPRTTLDATLDAAVDAAPRPAQPLPRSVPRSVGAGLDTLWRHASARGSRCSATGAQLLHRDGAQAGRLLPVGGCDVLTQLAFAPLRVALADGDGVGMRTIGVPERERGWWDLALVDPDYLPLAWEATPPALRGVPTPLLVTRDEVVAVRARGSIDPGSIDRRGVSRPGPAAG